MIRSTAERLVYGIRLVAETPLSVGRGARGREREILRVPVVVRGEILLLPAIPGSSLRGALRGLTEALGRSLAEGRGDDPAWTLARLHRREGGLVSHGGDGAPENLVELARSASGLGDDEWERASHGIPKPEALGCPVCRLFGAPGVAGAVRMTDALPTSLGRYEVEVIHRTSIDRKSMRVKEGRLFSDQILPAGTEFSAVMVVDGIREGSPEEELFETVMGFAGDLGIQIGGGKSVGRGLLRVGLTPLEEVRH